MIWKMTMTGKDVEFSNRKQRKVSYIIHTIKWFNRARDTFLLYFTNTDLKGSRTPRHGHLLEFHVNKLFSEVRLFSFDGIELEGSSVDSCKVFWLCAVAKGIIGSFTVGIFGPFFIHFSFIFHFILFPFFSQNWNWKWIKNE